MKHSPRISQPNEQKKKRRSNVRIAGDVGWFPDADLDGLADNFDCEPNSNLAPTVVVGGCNSGVPNTLFTSGCTISDLIAHIAATSKNLANL
jgi:hypothetical protein